MTRRGLVLGCLFLVAAWLPGCGHDQDVWKDQGGPPRVVVTFPPLQSFVKAVAGEHGSVICLCTTKGPHDYDYNVKDLLALRKADLFLANGLGLEPKFANKLYDNVKNARLQYVKLGDGLPQDLKLTPREEDHDEKDAAKAGHHHDEWDPHVWLGIPQAKEIVVQIRDALKKADPAHEKDYDRNAEAYLKKLDALEKKGKEMLAGKKIKLVSFHESLGYFAKTYGFEIADVIEVSPGETPTGTKMQELVKVCKKEKIKFIAVETQYPPKAAETLLDELKKEKLDVQLIEIDPLETVKENEVVDAGWYERKVEENLKALAGGSEK